jgi:hypothetical protein
LNGLQQVKQICKCISPLPDPAGWGEASCSPRPAALVGSHGLGSHPPRIRVLNATPKRRRVRSTPPRHQEDQSRNPRRSISRGASRRLDLAVLFPSSAPASNPSPSAFPNRPRRQEDRSRKPIRSRTSGASRRRAPGCAIALFRCSFHPAGRRGAGGWRGPGWLLPDQRGAGGRLGSPGRRLHAMAPPVAGRGGFPRD